MDIGIGGASPTSAYEALSHKPYGSPVSRNERQSSARAAAASLAQVFLAGKRGAGRGKVGEGKRGGGWGGV